MFTFQHNTHFSQAVACSREKFWEEIRQPLTSWNIDSRRAILAAVEQHDEKAVKRWLKKDEYRKFLLRKKTMKKEASKKKFFEKSDEERLLAFAQELKENLPAFIFCCYEFDATETKKTGKLFRHRRLAECHLNGLVMLDIDHVDEPLAIWEKLKANDELMKRTALVHVTSSKRGIRVIFTADIEDGNLADNQIVFAQKLGYKADSSCIDGTRNSFAPKEEDILYINEDLLFNYYDEEFDNRYTQLYRQKETQPLYHEFAAADEKNTDKITQKEPEPLCKSTQKGQSPLCTSEIKWHGVSIQKIIDARYAEKLPCAADTNRHAESLKLASDLLVMLDGDKALVQQIVEAQPWVQEIIAERNENVAGTVSSAAERMAANEKKYLTQSPSKAMQAAIAKATGKTYQEMLKSTQKGQSPLCNSEENIDRWMWRWGEEIEKLFDKFPLLKDICKGLKRNQYPAAVFVGGSFLMTLMTRCTYRFYHRPEKQRRLNCSTLIIGDPASGKSFATRLYDVLAEPIIKADAPGVEAINAYKEQMKSKGANKEKPSRPKVHVRVHPSRTSNGQFIQDMVNTKDTVDGKEMQLHMLTFDTELDNTLALQSGGSWIDKQSMELKAFHNEEDGQAYANTDSVVQNFFVFWNYIYTGTPIALKKKVNATNFGTGLATRLTCIPLPATNFEMMERESTIDLSSDDRLKEWAYKLDRMKGELPLQKIVDELYDWTARRMLDAKENESKADEMLLKRCAYHGLNFSAPFIVMRHWDSIHEEGNYYCGEFETDDTDWQLAELLVNIQYACQKHFFGVLAEKYFDDQQRDIAANTQRRAKTIEAFNSLPEEFTSNDVMRCFGLSNNTSARTRVARLIKDKLVEKAKSIKEKGTTKIIYKKVNIMMT